MTLRPVGPVRYGSDVSQSTEDSEPAASPRAAPPARPSLSAGIRSPLEFVPLPTPRSVVVSLWMWMLSCVVPLIAIVYAVTRLDAVREHLRVAAVTQTPDATADSLDRVVSVTVLIALVALAVPAILTIILALLMVNQRNWARILLLLVGIAGIPAVGLASGALSDRGTDWQNNLAIGVLAQTILVLLAAVLMFLPSANRWFRDRMHGPVR